MSTVNLINVLQEIMPHNVSEYRCSYLFRDIVTTRDEVKTFPRGHIECMTVIYTQRKVLLGIFILKFEGNNFLKRALKFTLT